MSMRPGVEKLPASAFKDRTIRVGKIALSGVLITAVAFIAGLLMSWIVGWSFGFCMQIVLSAWITTVAIRTILYIGNNDIFD